MSNFFGTLATISLIAFVVGLFKPSLIMRWAPEGKRNRMWMSIVTLACVVAFTGLAANTMTPEEKAAQQAKQEQKLQEKQAKEQAEADKKAAEKKEAEQKEAEKKAASSAPAGINIDWDKAIADTKNDILQQEKMVKDVYIAIDKDKKSIEIDLACNNAINQEAAAEAADTAVRRLSGNAQMQDSSIKGGGKDYWGGIWDTYELKIGVAKVMDTEKRDKWLIDDVVQPGVQGKHKFKGLKRN